MDPKGELDQAGSDLEDGESEDVSEQAWADMRSAMDAFLLSSREPASAPKMDGDGQAQQGEASNEAQVEKPALAKLQQGAANLCRRPHAIMIDDSPPHGSKHVIKEDTYAKLLALAEQKQRSIEGSLD